MTRSSEPSSGFLVNMTPAQSGSIDRRSLIKLLDRGDVHELCREAPPTVEDFLLRQRFLDNQQVLQAVTRQLAAGR